ncbi:polysaccharide pyruvyl transferase family protein (plasmid) [Novosphingobium sp. BL-8A]|uniref:polysaccharide pyruvyl transferase family protein n=1 Tax=Novosphingobium sp. BL-8A TaxID=3127639 RepID=UPI003757C52B
MTSTRHQFHRGVLKAPKRVGILTLPLSINYGGIMQAVALSHYLSGKGYEVTLLDKRRPMAWWQRAALVLLEKIPFQNIKRIRQTRQTRDLHSPFIRRYIPNQTPILRSERALSRAVESYDLDTIIVGSDQVWRMDYLQDDGYKEFFLSFVPSQSIRRIAYAASFGTGEWPHESRTPIVSELLHRFHAVSVREESGVKLCKTSFGVDHCEHVLDPTLLIDPEFYKAASGAGEKGEDKIFLTYILDAPDRRPVIDAIANELPVEYQLRSLVLKQASPPDLPTWLRSFRDADFVMTDSYHGTIFSLIFEKPFIAVANTGRGSDRFESLLDQLDLGHRLIALSEAHRIPELVHEPIDFREIRQKIAQKRLISAAFLDRALGL